VTGALGRTIRRAHDLPETAAGPARPRCDLCAEGLPDRHRHLLDTERREIRCVCQACSLLFAPGAAQDDGPRPRLVPRRRVRLAPVPTEGLGVPVGLAFFVVRDGGAVEAHYPSPAGPTRWEVDPAAWRDTVAGCPPLAGLVPEVEALLVNTARGRSEHRLVPIDDCFALVALVRREWRGITGGSRVWGEIDRFFAAT
jgi:hypothetical protein